MRGHGRPVWEDLASSDDLAVLDPGPVPLPDSTDVLVVGGGAIGLAVAATCTRAGIDVLLIEKERLACGPSGRAAGGLAPGGHPELTSTWRASAEHSLELHRTLGDELGYGVRSVELLVLPDLVIPDQGHLDPLQMCAAFARNAGTIATGVEVTGLNDEGLVRTTHGDVRPSHIVFATGEAPVDARVDDQSWVKGHLIATRSAPNVFDGIVASLPDDLIFIQLEDGRIVCGGTKEPGLDDGSVDDVIVGRMKDAMLRIWPSTAPLDIEHRWTCFRPHVAGDLPVVGRLRSNALFAAGFYATGVLMAPVAAEVIAEAIANGTTPVLS